MIERDPDTRTVLAQLSSPDRDPRSVSRRRFLQLALGTTALATTPAFLRATEQMAGARPLGPADGILVVILMGGGNDGLNTVVPYADGAYQRARGSLALGANQVLAIDDHVGLHPRLTTIKARYDAGQVALLRGVGFPDPNLSHFEAMARWMSGWAGGMRGDGWLGRYLSGLGDPDALPAVVFDDAVPLHFRGPTVSGLSMPENVGNAIGWLKPAPEAIDRELLTVLASLGAEPNERGPWANVVGGTLHDLIELGARTGPAYEGALPYDSIVRKLTLAARTINLGLGVRVLGVSFGDFDTHANQPDRHGELMRRFDEGIGAFYAALDPAWSERVTLLTMSEFGRRPTRNSGEGTDHGTASTVMAIGARVRGGVYGDQPSVDPFDLDDDGNLVGNLDTRAVYATVLSNWLDADAHEVLGADYGDIGFLSTPLGGPVPTAPAPAKPVVVPGPAVPGPELQPQPQPGGGTSAFTALAPVRVLDTRADGDGKPGVGAIVTLPLAGRFGLPAADITAVVVNVTATEADDAGYVTVWPDGPPPLASNLNLEREGQTRPNLVTVPLGADGAVRLFTYGGAHLLADLVGYYVPAASARAGRLRPLSPARVLDTRTDAAKPGGGDTITLPVAGRAGVPSSGAAAVVLNVTAADATGAGYVTVWPDGARPVASNLNLEAPGQTIANQVIVPLGADGAVRLFTMAGAHLIADVVGWYTDDGAPEAGSGLFVPVRPDRVLDTRGGDRPGGGATVGLELAGRAGLPAAGIGAVALNVTVTEAAGPGYVTVWPDGAPPLASNLNVEAPGQTIANHVITPVAPDGSVSLTTYSPAHLVADVTGWFTA